MELREILMHLPDGEMLVEAERNITFCFIRNNDAVKILAYRNGATVYEDECLVDDVSTYYVGEAVKKISRQHHALLSTTRN